MGKFRFIKVVVLVCAVASGVFADVDMRLTCAGNQAFIRVSIVDGESVWGNNGYIFHPGDTWQWVWRQDANSKWNLGTGANNSGTWKVNKNRITIKRRDGRVIVKQSYTAPINSTGDRTLTLRDGSSFVKKRIALDTEIQRQIDRRFVNADDEAWVSSSGRWGYIFRSDGSWQGIENRDGEWEIWAENAWNVVPQRTHSHLRGLDKSCKGRDFSFMPDGRLKISRFGTYKRTQIPTPQPPRPREQTQPHHLHPQQQPHIGDVYNRLLNMCSSCGISRICASCRGSGRGNSCFSCGGSGRRTTTGGFGNVTHQCSSCNGTGKQRCQACHGTGRCTRCGTR